MLALVLYFQRQSGAMLATVVMLSLTAALLTYCYVTPMYLVEEWATARGKDVHGIFYIGALVATVAVFFPLMFADPIVAEMNALTHGRATSPAYHAPQR